MWPIDFSAKLGRSGWKLKDCYHFSIGSFFFFREVSPTEQPTCPLHECLLGFANGESGCNIPNKHS